MTIAMTIWGIITVGALIYGMMLPHFDKRENQKLFRKYK